MRRTPKISLHSKLSKLNKRSKHLSEGLRYSFKFVSIISPGSYQSMGLTHRSSNRGRNKIFVKQSYILLTWMTYIRETQTQKKVKKSPDTGLDDEAVPSFFTYPKKQSRFTLLKAPMAHKTFSQEQFQVKLYQLGISFNSEYRQNSTISGVNNLIFLALYLRNNQTPFETNLFFLKRVRLSITGTDPHYFTLL